MTFGSTEIQLRVASELRWPSSGRGPKEGPTNGQLFSEDPSPGTRAVRVLKSRDGRPRRVGDVLLAPARAAEANAADRRSLRLLGGRPRHEGAGRCPRGPLRWGRRGHGLPLRRADGQLAPHLAAAGPDRWRQGP